MFPLQPRDELVFGPPTIYQEDKILADLVLDHAFSESNTINFSTNSNTNEGQKQSVFGERSETQTRDDDRGIIRRVMHRDIERKRRQEMSTLYASLRSLLPLEHIQGKRSTCDHMRGAVNYIKQLQKNIQELKIRREKLRKLSNLPVTKNASSHGFDNLPNCVTVNLVRDGVEILISSGVDSSEFGLSRALAELLDKGLNVISCVSTKIKGRFLHRIQAEGCGMTSPDLAELQERLANVVN